MFSNPDIRKFIEFSKETSNQIEVLAPFILKYHPKQNITKMRVGFTALVHGNETVGLPILNQLIEALLKNEIQVDFEIYFALGNLNAFEKDQRFVVEDLNRCFGQTNTNSPEALRARELETFMLDHCDYLIDLHQTQRAALKPFFIFQYSSPRCLSLLQQLNPGIPTVLQTDPIGENTGLSADEYIRSRGGFGVALELGEKADQRYLELGLEICKNALLSLKPLQQIKSEVPEDFNLALYKLDGKFKALNSSYRLDTDLKNFTELKPGQKIGHSDIGELQAPELGYLLFPRFKDVFAGSTLFFYCTPIQYHDFMTTPKPAMTEYSKLEELT